MRKINISQNKITFTVYQSLLVVNLKKKPFSQKNKNRFKQLHACFTLVIIVQRTRVQIVVLS